MRRFLDKVGYVKEPEKDRYRKVVVPEGKYALFRADARHAEKAVLGPAEVIYTKTARGSINGVVKDCKINPNIRILSLMELEKLLED